jgi:hypothetical protein
MRKHARKANSLRESPWDTILIRYLGRKLLQTPDRETQQVNPNALPMLVRIKNQMSGAVINHLMRSIRIELKAQVHFGGGSKGETILERGFDLNQAAIAGSTIMYSLTDFIQCYVEFCSRNDFSNIANEPSVDSKVTICELCLQNADALKNASSEESVGVLMTVSDRV